MDPIGVVSGILGLLKNCLEISYKLSALLGDSPTAHLGRSCLPRTQLASVELESIKFKLTQWKNTWDLQHDLSKNDIELSIWGRAGWKEIHDQLVTILNTLE